MTNRTWYNVTATMNGKSLTKEICVDMQDAYDVRIAKEAITNTLCREYGFLYSYDEWMEAKKALEIQFNER